MPRVLTSRLARLAWAFGALLLVAGSQAQEAEEQAVVGSFPAAFEGTWKVSSVLVDLGASRRLEYQHDDPRLVGRTFSFESSRITSDTPEHRECLDPHASEWRADIARILARTIAPHGVPAVAPSAKDYELPWSGNPTVDLLFIHCRPGHFGPRLPRTIGTVVDRDDAGTWVIFVAHDQLLVRWFDETILRLQRVEETRSRP
jgi:hypothetical protein